MNFQSALRAVILFFVTSTPVLVLHTAVGSDTTAACCVLDLPEGVLCDPVVDESTRTITCTFRGLSVVQLRELCMQDVSAVSNAVRVEPAAQGAALVFDVARFVRPIVTVIPCVLTRQVVIRVDDDMGPAYMHSPSLGTIVHSV
jgi:hypothetical protein